MDRQELIERLLLLEREAEERKRLDEEMQVNSRLTNIERITANLDGKDMTPDAPRAGVFAELQGSLPPIPVPESTMLPFDVEFGVPKADITGSSATVELRPTSRYGLEYASAGDLDVYVANDRQIQLLEDRQWKKKVTGTMSGAPSFGDPESTVTATAAIFTEEMVGQRLIFDTSGNSYLIEAFTSTTIIDITGDASGEDSGDTLTVSGSILSFMRIATTVDAIGGVLVGEAHHASPFQARLTAEVGAGAYSWTEVIPDTTAGVYKTRPSGRTDTTTGLDAYEVNLTTKIHAHATTGRVVWIHVEYGDNVLYAFDYQQSVLDEPIELDWWFDIIGTTGATWVTFDTRDWRSRFVEVGIWVMEGAPVDHASAPNGRTIAADTKVWSYFSTAWIQVLPDDWVQTWIEASGGTSDQDLIYVRMLTLGTGVQTMYVKVARTNGNLQYKIPTPGAGFQGNFNIRFMIRAGRRLLASEAIEIGTPP